MNKSPKNLSMNKKKEIVLDFPLTGECLLDIDDNQAKELIEKLKLHPTPGMFRSATSWR